MKTQTHEVVDTMDIVDGIMSGSREIKNLRNEIKTLIDEFVSKVYNRGLRSRVDRYGASVAKFDDVLIEIYGQRGRVYIWFKVNRGKDQISFVANQDGDPDVVLNTICAKPDIAKSMVKKVIDGWGTDSHQAYEAFCRFSQMSD